MATVVNGVNFSFCPGMNYDIVKGRVQAEINNLMNGVAVMNPKEKLNQLQVLPDVVSGNVEAGDLDEFPTLRRIPRSAGKHFRYNFIEFMTPL